MAVQSLRVEGSVVAGVAAGREDQVPGELIAAAKAVVEVDACMEAEPVRSRNLEGSKQAGKPARANQQASQSVRSTPSKPVTS